MSSPKSLNSVLDQYEPSIAPIESYNDVVEERNALRDQNQQLWRIIEKQRIIIHQLQKLNRSNAISKHKNTTTGSLSSNGSSCAPRPEKSLSGPLSDNASLPDLQQRLKKPPSLERLDINQLSKSISNTKEHYLEQVYSQAQKNQTRLSEKFQLESSIPEKQPNFNFKPVSQPLRKFSEGVLNKDKLYSLTNSNSTETPLFLHRAPSESTLQTSSQGKNFTSGNQLPKKEDENHDFDTTTNLKVPRRSSLRARRETSPKELVDSTNSSDQNVPDLRKTALKEKELKSNLINHKKEDDETVPSNHTTALDFIKEEALSDSTSSSRRTSQHSLSSHFKSRKKTNSLISPKDMSFSDIFNSQVTDSRKPKTASPIKATPSFSLPTTQPSETKVSLNSGGNSYPKHSKRTPVLDVKESTPGPLSSVYQEPGTESNQPDPVSGSGLYLNSRVLRMVPEELENDDNVPSTSSPTLTTELGSPSHHRSPSQDFDYDTLVAIDTSSKVSPNEKPTSESPIRNHSRNRKATIMQCLDSLPYNPALLSPERLKTVFKKYYQIRGIVSQSSITSHDQSDSQIPKKLINISLLGHPLLSIPSKDTGELSPTPQELWCLEKPWDSLVSLDIQLREHHTELSYSPLPTWPSSNEDIQLFINSVINNSLNLGPESNVDETLSNLVDDFLISDIKPSEVPHSNALPSEQVITKKIFKAGNLLKRGKKFGKLKLRYFVVNGPTLEYFESNDGFYLGGIQLIGAQIIRSMVASLHSELYERYIYAITVMELKKTNLTKHTFFVDNPIDWEEWIIALEHYARLGTSTSSSAAFSGTTVAAPRRIRSHDSLHSDANIRHIPHALDLSKIEVRHEILGTGPSTPRSQDKDQPSSPHINLSTSQSHVPALNSFNVSPARSDSKSVVVKSKMQGFMDGVKGNRKDSPTEKPKRKIKNGARKTFQWNTKLFGDAFQKKHGATKVFGVTLEQAIAQAPIKAGYQIPAVLHRCIEYLEHHQAYLEEGIYRLSGSAADIQYLKEKFDNDGDYNLLKSGRRYDVHTVAGLLKLFLREMPTYVLTVELQPEFIKAVESPLRHHRVNEIGRLVCDLPLANYTLLRTLTAHLIRIVEKSDINKMTLRNIGIVFVPTLAVPAGVFSLMVVEFEYIFCVNERGTAQPKTLDPIVDRELETDMPSPDKDSGSNSVGELVTESPSADLESAEIVSLPEKPLSIPNSFHLQNTSLAADMDSDMRDYRNSSMYREVVPEELATAEHGLESTVLDLADDEEDSLSSCLDEEEWNLDHKTFILPNSTTSHKNMDSLNPNLASSFHGATIWETSEGYPDSDSVHSAPAQSTLP